MAIDFHRLDNGVHLFDLNSAQYKLLEKHIFKRFEHWTGIYIDEYSDSILFIDNQKILVRIIDEYVETTDLNKNKEETKAILAFRGLLLYFIAQNYDLQLLGD